MSRHSQEQTPHDDPDVIAFDQEPRTPEYGIYRPGRRILGSMAASAAAGEFLRRANALIAAGARPDPASPSRHAGEEWLEETAVRIV